MIDAPNEHARSINVIMPYYGYHAKTGAAARQPISAKLVADLLQAAGANRLSAWIYIDHPRFLIYQLITYATI